MEPKIPRSEPGILPLVRHRDYVAAINMSPIFVAAMQATGRGRWTCRVAGDPIRNDVVVELLAPEQPSSGLACHAPFGLAKLHSRDRLVIVVGFADARREYRV